MDPTTKALVPIEATTESHELDVKGKLIAPRTDKLQRRVDKLQKRVEFRSCSDDQQTQVNAAAAEAQKLAVESRE